MSGMREHVEKRNASGGELLNAAAPKAEDEVNTRKSNLLHVDNAPRCQKCKFVD